MNVDRALVFKSIDAKKQNPQNRPGKFTVKFFPELFLENNKQHFLALDHLSMTASWHNIRPEYENNKLVISKDGENWETITFPAGIFDYDDINELIHKRIGKTGDNYGISVLFDLTTYKVFIQLANGFQIDFTKSGNFNVLLGFDKKLFLPVNMGQTSQISQTALITFICGVISLVIHSFPEKDQMFFTLFQPQQRQDLCPLKFNPIIICGVKLTQKQSRKSLFGLLMTKIAK